jgi:hypothetical protein
MAVIDIGQTDPFSFPDWCALPVDVSERQTAEHNRDVLETALARVVQASDEAEAARAIRMVRLSDGSTVEMAEQAVIIGIGIIVGRIAHYVITELQRIQPYIRLDGPHAFQGIVNSLASAFNWRRGAIPVYCAVETSKLELVRTKRRQFIVDVTPVLISLESVGWLPSTDEFNDFAQLCVGLFNTWKGRIPPSPFLQALAQLEDPEGIEERAAIFESEGKSRDAAERAAVASARRRRQ